MWRLVIRNPATGAVEVDQLTNMGRIMGTVETGGVNGSLAVPGFATGIPWAFPTLLGVVSFSANVPEVVTSPTGLSWTYQSGSGSNAIITFGAY